MAFESLSNVKFRPILGHLIILISAVTLFIWAVLAKEFKLRIGYMILAIVCGILLSGGYETIKVRILRLFGFDVTKKENSKTTEQVQDLLAETETDDLQSLRHDEKRKQLEIDFDRG